jgi:hypothetical protein
MMSELDKFLLQESEIEWLDALPNYQKSTIAELLETNPYESVAAIWLESSIGNNSPFGAGNPQGKKNYFNYLKKEFHKLMCGNPEYAAERKELNQLFEKNDTKTAIISFISAIIGAKIGLAATFIAPAVVLLLMLISKTSVNAWCTMQTDANSN